MLTEYCQGCSERNTAWWDTGDGLLGGLGGGGSPSPPPRLCEALTNATECLTLARCEWHRTRCEPRRACVEGCELDAGVELIQRYFTSLCYVFNALEPGVAVTSSEKKFAMLAYVATLVRRN
eukprot:COSAG01_NODE_6043_length_3882_cov_3.851042_5_plen_122_part_00